MSRDVEKVICQSPTPGKAPTRIPKWKFDVVRSAIFAVLERDSEVYFTELAEKVGDVLAKKDRDELGSLAWHVTTVKLHLEATGEIKRLPAKGRQQIARA